MIAALLPTNLNSVSPISRHFERLLHLQFSHLPRHRAHLTPLPTLLAVRETTPPIPIPGSNSHLNRASLPESELCPELIGPQKARKILQPAALLRLIDSLRLHGAGFALEPIAVFSFYVYFVGFYSGAVGAGFCPCQLQKSQFLLRMRLKPLYWEGDAAGLFSLWLGMVNGNRVGFDSGEGLSTGGGARWEDLFLGGLLEGVELFGDFVGDELF